MIPFQVLLDDHQGGMNLHRQLNQILKSILRQKRERERERKKNLVITDLFTNLAYKTSQSCCCHQKCHWGGWGVVRICGFLWLVSSFVELLVKCGEECLKRLPLQWKAMGDVFTAIPWVTIGGNKTAWNLRIFQKFKKKQINKETNEVETSTRSRWSPTVPRKRKIICSS